MKIKSLSGFSRTFWTANSVELLERMAYYSMFIGLTIYLTKVVGFTDIQSGYIGGLFAAGLYFLPPFSGAYADKIGFRKALMLAFALLATGYFIMGWLPYKSTIIPALILIMIGGSFIKGVITGTVAKESEGERKALGFSIFYAVVNIGAFVGKTYAYPIRLKLGVEYVSLISAGLMVLAFVMIYLFYKDSYEKSGKSLSEIWAGFKALLKKTRLLVLIVIVSGFWIVQTQLYAAMPLFVIRLVGEDAAPEWLANVNPLVVVLTVVWITRLMKNVSSIRSITIGMFLMPFSALAMASGVLIAKANGGQPILGLHPVAFMMIIGIMIQALAEVFISPRYLEYFAKQAPEGEEGMYMGFSNLHSFLSYLFGFIISGYLLDRFVPDPAKTGGVLPEGAYDQAYMVWVFYAGLALTAGIALLIYDYVIRRIDAKKANG